MWDSASLQECGALGLNLTAVRVSLMCGIAAFLKQADDYLRPLVPQSS